MFLVANGGDRGTKGPRTRHEQPRLPTRIELLDVTSGNGADSAVSDHDIFLVAKEDVLCLRVLRISDGLPIQISSCDGRSDQMANSKLPNNPQPLAGLPYDEFVAKYASMYGKAPKNADKLRPLSSVNKPHEPLLGVSALKGSWFGRC
jgi:hypothetical protein